MEKKKASYKTSSPDRYAILRAFARENRKNGTPAENCLWEHLRNGALGVDFLRQHVIGDYIADFVSRHDGLVIEVDGGYHAERQQQEDDEARERDLEQMGFHVLRFTNEEVLYDTDFCFISNRSLFLNRYSSSMNTSSRIHSAPSLTGCQEGRTECSSWTGSGGESEGGGSDLRIVFMGTPEFAVGSLQKLVENNYQVVAVVTMPDKPVGRHHETLQASPVKQYAVSRGIPVLQPERLKDEAFLDELRAYRADLQVVVAFRMLPEAVWAMPPKGTFNLHAALLPQYRGAAPINWAVINGETQTGATTFFLDHDIDTGRIIHRVAAPIGERDTVEEVYERLMRLGADLVVRTVDDIAAGCIQPVDQDSVAGQQTSELKAAPKLSRENTQIRWSRHTVKSAYDFIRGLSPYPGAWTTLRTADGKETQLKVFFAEMLKGEGGHHQGQSSLKEDNPQQVFPLAPYKGERAGGPERAGGLAVTLSDGVLLITDLQLAGKRRMAADDFLRGAHVEGAEFIEK